MPQEAFDPIADTFDDTFTNSVVGRLQRQQVYFFLEKVLTKMSGKKVLELNCGTGADAIWLAQNNCEVKATDLSMGMLQVTQKKVRKLGLESKVQVQQLSIAQIATLPETQQYDLIFSNFGGFNCLSPQTLKQISKPLSQRLRPGGHFVAVVMTDFCLWESIYFLAKFSFQKAFRRFSKKALQVTLGNGASVDTWYYSPDQFSRFFSNALQQQDCFPVGFSIPPSYLDRAFQQHPNILQNLYRLEKKSIHFSFAKRSADHFFIHLTKP